MTTAVKDGSKFAPDEKSNIALYDLLASGIIPDFLIRSGIRTMLRQKLSELSLGNEPEREIENFRRFVEELKAQPIAIATDSANMQHYEIPSEFFELVLGPSMKYSCCDWSNTDTLESAELAMLELSAKRAEISEGQRILDLGCGWGSFSLFVALKYSGTQVTAVSNSKSQKVFIERRISQLGLKNLKVITADINEFQTEERFDRIVSIEMFEHAKNYERLLAKLAGFMAKEGKLFVHIFSHVKHQYHFDSADSSDWLTRYFFIGGTMPSDHLLLYFQRELILTKHWRVNGKHYQKTAEAWLQNMKRNREPVMEIIKRIYGVEQSKRWWTYWRLFFTACAELWGFDSGRQWIVSHYLFEKR